MDRKSKLMIVLSYLAVAVFFCYLGFEIKENISINRAIEINKACYSIKDLDYIIFGL